MRQGPLRSWERWPATRHPPQAHVVAQRCPAGALGYTLLALTLSLLSTRDLGLNQPVEID